MDINANKNIHCEICQIKEAKNLCWQCYSYYCDSCYKIVHDMEANKVHKKEKIDYFVPIELKCPKHSKNIINLFCIDEKGKLKYKLINNFIFRIMLFYMPL